MIPPKESLQLIILFLLIPSLLQLFRVLLHKKQEERFQDKRPKTLERTITRRSRYIRPEIHWVEKRRGVLVLKRITRTILSALNNLSRNFIPKNAFPYKSSSPKALPSCRIKYSP
jgi:uncharacterized protein YjiS (DUF1127 family)